MKRYEPTYWNNRGKYQKKYDALYGKHVPQEGAADTKYGEIIRIVSKLYHDIFNNGGCNFDVYKNMRASLLLSVPKYAYESTKHFTAPPPRDWLKNNNYQRFLDTYVNWAILYAESLIAEEKLARSLRKNERILPVR
jgi:hypothetical protein